MSWLGPSELAALLLSLRVAFWCVLWSAIPGIFLGWLLARKRFPGRMLLDAVVHLPLVLPPVVVGYLLLATFGRRGLLGPALEKIGLQVAFSTSAAVLASAVMGFPLLVRSVRLAMELADTRLEQAGRTLGASPLRTFFCLTIPLTAPGIATGLILAFARSMGEFGATITFAGNVQGVSRTLPLAVYAQSQMPGGDGPAMRLVVISVIVSLAALLVSELLTRRLREAVAP